MPNTIKILSSINYLIPSCLWFLGHAWGHESNLYYLGLYKKRLEKKILFFLNIYLKKNHFRVAIVMSLCANLDQKQSLTHLWNQRRNDSQLSWHVNEPVDCSLSLSLYCDKNPFLWGMYGTIWFWLVFFLSGINLLTCFLPWSHLCFKLSRLSTLPWTSAL